MMIINEDFLNPISPILFPAGPGRSTCILCVHPGCPHYLNQLKPVRHDKDKDEDGNEDDEDDKTQCQDEVRILSGITQKLKVAKRCWKQLNEHNLMYIYHKQCENMQKIQ